MHTEQFLLQDQNALPLGALLDEQAVSDMYWLSEPSSTGLCMTANIWPDPAASKADTATGICGFQAAVTANPESEFSQLGNGSLRLNVHTAACRPDQQAATIYSFVHQLVHHLGSSVSFALTAHLTHSSIQIIKDPRNCTAKIVSSMQCPAISAACLSDDASILVLNGHNLNDARIWCFQDHTLAVEYLQVIRTESFSIPQSMCQDFS